MKRNLYVISGVTGMTGNEVARQLVHNGHHVIGFDNFFASSLDSVYDLLGNADFDFFEYNLNDNDQMTDIEHRVKLYKNKFEDIVYINCAAVVHTEHFYEVEHTFETNVNGMKRFLEQAIRNEVDVYINCSTSEVYSMQSWNETGGVREDDYL